jgi:DNA-binding MarR family transcriptional regulator
MPTSRRTSPAREVDEVAAGVHAAALHLSRRLRIDDESLAVSSPRLSALAALVADGPMRIGALARGEQVEPPTMTRLVDAMERDGFVARALDPNDRRAVLVRVTPRGTRALHKELGRRVHTLAGMLRTLSPQQLASLARGIQILRDVVR